MARRLHSILSALAMLIFAIARFVGDFWENARPSKDGAQPLTAPALTDMDYDSTDEALVERAKHQAEPPPAFLPMRQNPMRFFEEETDSAFEAVLQTIRNRNAAFLVVINGAQRQTMNKAEASAR